MATQHELERAGDELQALLRRAVAALMDDNVAEVWQILEVQAYWANRRWDQLRGRPVPTEAEIADAREALQRLAREAQAAMDEQQMRAVREVSESW